MPSWTFVYVLLRLVCFAECRMLNAERAIWSVVSVWVKVGFQVYKSEINKVKWNKSRLPWLISLRVRHDCDMILAKLTPKLTFIVIAIGTWTELNVYRQKVILLRLWTTRLKEQIKKNLPGNCVKSAMTVPTVQCGAKNPAHPSCHALSPNLFCFELVTERRKLVGNYTCWRLSNNPQLQYIPTSVIRLRLSIFSYYRLITITDILTRNSA